MRIDQLFQQRCSTLLQRENVSVYVQGGTHRVTVNDMHAETHIRAATFDIIGKECEQPPFQRTAFIAS